MRKPTVVKTDCRTGKVPEEPALTREQAERERKAVLAKIVQLEFLPGMKVADYDAISDRLFSRKRELEAYLRNM